MKRFAPLLLLVAATASAQQGRLADAARAAAGSFATLAVADADDTGRLRWAAWGEGRGEGQSAHLALYRVNGGAASPIWAQNWPDGYLPRLNADTRWSWHGRPVAGVAVQFGAGAVTLTLYGLQPGDRPVALLTKDVVSAEWRTGAEGQAVLLLATEGARGGLVTRCLGWNGATAALITARCPH